MTPQESAYQKALNAAQERHRIKQEDLKAFLIKVYSDAPLEDELIEDSNERNGGLPDGREWESDD